MFIRPVNSKKSPTLLLDQVSFTWPNGVRALDKCSFKIDKPGLWMIVGSNGSGKSTLFRLIRGMIKPQEGNIKCFAKSSLVFQNPDHQLLLPTCRSDLMLSIPDNCGYRERTLRIRNALNQVGLCGMEDRPIHTLSGGEKQRLALAGALVSESNLLLLDEPTALLDPQSQQSILEIVHKLSTDGNGMIISIWITHRLEELHYCNGAAMMDKGRVGPWEKGKDIFHRINSLAGRRG